MGGKVIFTEKPRDSVENIFDRSIEINTIKKVLDTGDWLAILGPRMIGKTSIAKAILNEYKKDYNTLYIDLTGIKNSGDAINKIFNSIPKNVITKFRDNFEILGINVMGNSIKFNKKINNTDVMESLFNLLSRKKTMIVLDEFQELSFGINHFINMLHNIMMENKNIVFIFTGSSIGLMKTLLEQEGKNPLAGRNPVKVLLEPWNRQTAFDYLKSGLINCNADINETEINEAINEIGTITGWLNFYGRRRCIYNHNDALNESLEEAVKVAKYELNNIINKSAWKRKALKMTAFGAGYNEILNETKVSTSTLSNFLHRLEKLYLIKNDNRTYYILDNIYRKAIK